MLSISERIEAALSHMSDEVSELTLSDRKFINQRYNEYKRTLDFTLALKRARLDWLEMVLDVK